MCYEKPNTIANYVVSNGDDAYRDHYPHMALIGYGDDLESAHWMCGGSVISDRYILTAAHCMSSLLREEIKFAGLGVQMRTDPVDLWQVYEITKIIGHPQYKPPSKYHDIALLRTGAKIRYNKEVLRACLHRGLDLPDEAVATGWGALGYRKPSAEVLEVGDSSGPLQVQAEGREKSKCLYTIIGVTSYGRSCGIVESSGLYTKVAHYVPWIEGITGNLK